MAKGKFWVLRDTREKVGIWNFPEDDRCLGTKDQALKTGDYSIQSYEDSILCIERKKTVSEFAGNVFQARFKNELDRMAPFKHKFIIFEFPYEEMMKWPMGAYIPSARKDMLKVTPQYLLRFVTEMQVIYGIHVVFGNTKKQAEQMCYSILKRVYESEN